MESTSTAGRHAARPAGPDWSGRSVFGRLPGVPWWGAVLIAVGFTGTGSVLDSVLDGASGRWFPIGLVAGSVLAVLLVRRRALFTATVQPPLVAVGVVGAATAITLSNTMDASITSVAMPAASTLTGSFLVIAAATAATLLIGLVRLLVQRRPG